MYDKKSFRGFMYDSMEEYRASELKMLALFEIKSHNIHLLNNLGLINSEIGKFKNAEEYFNLSFKLGNITALENLCDLYSKTDRTPLAIEKLLELIKNENTPRKNSSYYLTIAYYYLDTKNLDSAIEAYLKSYEIYPEFDKVLLLIAEAYEDFDKKDIGRQYRVKYGENRIKL